LGGGSNENGDATTSRISSWEPKSKKMRKRLEKPKKS